MSTFISRKTSQGPIFPIFLPVHRTPRSVEPLRRRQERPAQPATVVPGRKSGSLEIYS